MHVTASDIRHDVRSIVSELGHNAMSTHTIVSEIHRTMVKGQEVADSRNLLVSDTRVLPTIE